MKPARLVVFGIGALASAAAFAMACSSSEPTAKVAPAAADVSVAETAPAAEASVDAGTDAPVLGKCADTFGTALTEGFGRIDGTVWAVQKPSDKDCAQPNSDHVIVQVLMNEAVYRLVVNVQSDRGAGDVKIRYAAVPRALPVPEFAEGWHTGVPMDYVNILGIHSEDGGFSALTLDEAVAKIDAELKPGDDVSVYGTSGEGRPESADLVHRNVGGTNANVDGAIVVKPTSGTPKFLLFHFADQTF